MKPSFCDVCNQVRPIALVLVCQSPNELHVNRICTRCLLEEEASEQVVDEMTELASVYAEEMEA